MYLMLFLLSYISTFANKTKDDNKANKSLDLDFKSIDKRVKSANNYKNITNNINFDTSHHMGGVSMGKDETFLVNSKSKLKASNSTFISGGACFNFSDSVNPTLTYIALSLHLADQIFKEYFEKN